MIELDPNVAFNTCFRVIAPTNVAATSAFNASKIAAAFKKRIKRDPALFLVLKKDNQLDS